VHIASIIRAMNGASSGNDNAAGHPRKFLMMEAEKSSVTLDYSFIVTELVTRDDFIASDCHKSFKSNMYLLKKVSKKLKTILQYF
jgi:hypothetical protein